MKRTRLAVSLILCAVMLFSLVGCASNPDKQKIIGTWTSNDIDFTETFAESFTESFEADEASYFEFSDFNIRMILTFNEDMTYTMEADEDSIEESTANIKTAIYDGFSKMFSDMAEEYGVTVEQLLTLAYGTDDMDKILEEAVGEEALDNVKSEMMKEMNQSGKYAFKDGYLYLLLEDESAYTDKFSYTFAEDGSLKLELVDEEDIEEYGFMFPLTLTK